MIKIALLCAIFAVAYGGVLSGGAYFQIVPAQAKPAIIAAPAYAPKIVKEDETPKPYAFDYAADGEDGGSSARSETADGSGRVTGSYTIVDPDGRQRTVEYIADKDGFRATVKTNEIGTESKSPADIAFESSAPTAAELVEKYGPRPTPTVGVKYPAPAAPAAPAPAPSAIYAAGHAKKFILVPVNVPY